MFFTLFLLLIIFEYKIIGSNDGEWWKYTSIYEIYPFSFKDSDGDGIGDLRGIISKLDYFVELGIEAIRINHIYPCEELYRVGDYYEIKNHRKIDPQIGTMDDFEELLTTMKLKKLKLILDFIPNHTSRRHIWFLNSCQKDEEYRDYYVWMEPKETGKDHNPDPPNKWLNKYNGDAWTFCDSMTGRGNSMYYAGFGSRRPDLNLRNKKVVEELKDVLRFWLDKGVDGMFLCSADYLFEDPSFDDNCTTKIEEYTIKGYPETSALLSEFIHLIQTEYNNDRSSPSRLLIIETELAYEKIESDLLQSNNINTPVILFPGRFMKSRFDYLSPIHEETSSAIMITWIYNYSSTNSHNGKFVTMWAGDTHHERRIASSFNDEVVDIINGITLCLPGVSSAYYGQEIALQTRSNDRGRYKPYLGRVNQEEYSKSVERVPMNWDDTENGGFTRAEKTYYDKTSCVYWRRNVKNEQVNENSHYHVFKKLLALRKVETFKYGNVETYFPFGKLAIFSRYYNGHETYLVISNMGYTNEIFDLDYYISRTCDNKPSIVNLKSFSELVVVVGSINSIQKNGDVQKRNSRDKFMIEMRPRSLIIVRTNNNNYTNVHKYKHKKIINSCC